jgi:hypothetical protein
VASLLSQDVEVDSIQLACDAVGEEEVSLHRRLSRRHTTSRGLLPLPGLAWHWEFGGEDWCPLGGRHVVLSS